MNIISKEIEVYVDECTRPPSMLLRELFDDTHRLMSMPQMLTGAVEGRLLKLLVQAVGAKRVLEIGMFTGYSALWMAEGLPEDGKLMTCDLDPKAIEMASKYFAKSPHGKKIEILKGSALQTLPKLEPPFDFVFIDADKENYPAYFDHAMRLLRVGGFMALDNTLWSGEVVSPVSAEAISLDKVNKQISKDPRVEAVLLTVRDGIHLARKISN